MAYFVEVYCRLAIRLCVGYHASGRERYRTVNVRNVRRDATAEQVAAFVRALEPLLDGRVVRVLLIRKDRLVVDGAARRGEVMDAVMAGVGEAGDHWSPLQRPIITNGAISDHPLPALSFSR